MSLLSGDVMGNKQIRKSCEINLKQCRETTAYLEQAKRAGKASSLVFGPMLDAVKGKPAIVWDDVSGFNGPEGGNATIGLAGVPASAVDFVYDPVPGESLHVLSYPKNEIAWVVNHPLIQSLNPLDLFGRHPCRYGSGVTKSWER